ncbi:ROK family protein [Streptomyces sp. NBC_01387]|uniref:ROK family transcriptional regulator n=1 Tax=unclassified Streptomyces TaxID=2593676 RepID=UPI002DD89442|nr:ROK family transcriptional regulator [Streptomyces sp. NBC_01766]WSC21806.1 ROK family protein [Streptomyces sp. NBC_01766]WSV55762.1 ROK family protein [Streptomyces sp. NBC_01014]
MGQMQITGGGPSALRRRNLATMLHQVHEQGARTVTELARSTGLSRPTCEEGVAELVAQGWAAETAPPDPTAARQPGRPAKRYEFNADAGRVLGVDVGAHKILATVADLRGTVTAVRRTDVDPALPAAERLAAMGDAVTACLAAERAPGRSPLLAAVIASPGVIDAEGRVVLSNPLPELTGLNLVDELARVLGPGRVDGPIRAENDMRLAALAEQWRGVAVGVPDLVYIHAGHRLGAAVLIDGKPYRGHRGAAGEIGTLGLLDWANSYRRLLSYAPDSTTIDATLRVFTDLREGNTLAREFVDRFARDMATGVAVMSMTIDPTLVVVGGGISLAGDAIIEPVRRHLVDLCLFPPDIEASNLGDESVALGAVRFGLQQVEARLFGAAPSFPREGV